MNTDSVIFYCAEMIDGWLPTILCPIKPLEAKNITLFTEILRIVFKVDTFYWF